jgi:hypothetical protein
VRRACGSFARPAALLCLAACLAPALVAAQDTPQQPPHKSAHRRPAPGKPAAAQPETPVVPPAPVLPPQPKWPVNDPPAAPDVSYNSQGLHIVAQNSSLTTILNQVSTQTGAKVDGLNNDERVFGDYGPGQPRDVLAQLLNGANYNVLIVGDEAIGLPLHIVLSPRQGGGGATGAPQPNPRPQPQDQEEDNQPPEPEEPPQIYQPPAIQRPPSEPMNRPMTPQERMEMMQQRQREMQQQQQQQQPQQPQQPPQ